MIQFKGVSKSYDLKKTFAVKDLSWEIPSGEFFIIIGSSGSGKSTALKMINRLIETSTGSIEIDGVNIKDIAPLQLRRSIGYVFQKIGLFPHMTVAENIDIVLRIHKKNKSYRLKKIDELLELVNLDPVSFASRTPRELSGGQQQRVGIARALATDSDYLLMDEAFSALDAITRDSMQQEILRLQKVLRKTIVLVTHDIFEAFRMADRIAILHEGELQQIGTPQEIMQSPETEFVQQLLQPFRNQVLEYYAHLA